MRGEAVAQRVRVHRLLESGPSSSSFTGMVDRLGSDGPITGVPMLARKQPYAGLSSQPVPVLPQLVEQLGAEQHIAISASFAALDVNHHALAVHVADLQVCQLRIPNTGGVERHQDGAVVRTTRRVDQLRDFFLTEDR